MSENTIILFIPVGFLLILLVSLVTYHNWDIARDERKERERHNIV